jgi:hypothetical protein
MGETGKFVWNKFSAYLIYTVDLETGIFHIENVDEVGLEFLQSIAVDDKITMLKSSAELGLVVTRLRLDRSRVYCQATVAQ